MRTLGLNLASRPFLNVRPIGRAAALLWVLGGALAVLNAVLYWDFVTGTEGRAAELGQVEAQLAEHQRETAALRRRLEDFGLPQQNARVRFLNQKIRERTFAWSVLFDRLADVMPGEVRLERLKPESVKDHDAGSNRLVMLKLSCQARNVEAELDLVDRLFAHPAFERPDLNWDRVEKGGLIGFNLVVGYLPGDLPAAEETGAEAAASGQQAASPLPRGGVGGEESLEELPGQPVPQAVRSEPAASRSLASGTPAAVPQAPAPTVAAPTPPNPAASARAGAPQAATQRPDPASGSSGDRTIQEIRERLRQGSGVGSGEAAESAAQGGVPGFVVPRAPVPGRRGPSSGGSAGAGPSSTSSDRTPVPRQPNVSGALELR